MNCIQFLVSHMDNLLVENKGYWRHYLLYLYIQILYQVENELYMVPLFINESTS